MASESYSKLLLQKLGPYLVFSSTPHTVTINEDEIPNAISKESACPVPEQQTTRLGLQNDPDRNSQQMQPPEILVNDTLDATALDKYTGVHIVKHGGSGQNLKYLVLLYGYTAPDDTFEPPHHIPNIFIKRYWRRIRA